MLLPHNSNIAAGLLLHECTGPIEERTNAAKMLVGEVLGARLSATGDGGEAGDPPHPEAGHPFPKEGSSDSK